MWSSSCFNEGSSGIHREEFEESDTPVAYLNSHFLDQISDKGLYKSAPKSGGTLTTVSTPSKIRQRLNMTVAVSDIMDIDPMAESFTLKFRLYLFWEANLHQIGLEEFAQKALESGHYYSLTRAEIPILEERCKVPKVTLFNEISCTESEPHDIRVYGGAEGKTALMWNKVYTSTCRERFELHDFPFDRQELTLDFRLNDTKTWDDFNLTINTVQFHKDALELSEWKVYTPIVKRDSPKEKASKVFLQVKRFSGFYVQNVVCMMFGLTLLGLLAFAMDIEDLGSRVSTVLTLILTAVAFKFILASTLPKVPYNCLIDYFMMSQLIALAMMALFSIIPSLSQQISDDANDLNTVLAILSGCYIFLSLAFWLLYAKVFVGQGHSRNCKQINLVPNKNWYSFRYSSPSFLVNVQ